MGVILVLTKGRSARGFILFILPRLIPSFVRAENVVVTQLEA